MGIAGKVMMGMAIGTMMAIDVAAKTQNNYHPHRGLIVVNENHRVGQNGHGMHHQESNSRHETKNENRGMHAAVGMLNTVAHHANGHHEDKNHGHHQPSHREEKNHGGNHNAGGHHFGNHNKGGGNHGRNHHSGGHHGADHSGARRH